MFLYIYIHYELFLLPLDGFQNVVDGFFCFAAAEEGERQVVARLLVIGVSLQLLLTVVDHLLDTEATTFICQLGPQLNLIQKQKTKNKNKKQKQNGISEHEWGRHVIVLSINGLLALIAKRKKEKGKRKKEKGKEKKKKWEGKKVKPSYHCSMSVDGRV